jgi:hypothetical protein
MLKALGLCSNCASNAQRGKIKKWTGTEVGQQPNIEREKKQNSRTSSQRYDTQNRVETQEIDIRTWLYGASADPFVCFEGIFGQLQRCQLGQGRKPHM